MDEWAAANDTTDGSSALDRNAGTSRKAGTRQVESRYKMDCRLSMAPSAAQHDSFGPVNAATYATPGLALGSTRQINAGADGAINRRHSLAPTADSRRYSMAPPASKKPAAAASDRGLTVAGPPAREEAARRASVETPARMPAGMPASCAQNPAASQMFSTGLNTSLSDHANRDITPRTLQDTGFNSLGTSMVASRGKQAGSTAILKARHTTGGLPAWELGQVHATGTRAADPRRVQLAAFRAAREKPQFAAQPPLPPSQSNRASAAPDRGPLSARVPRPASGPTPPQLNLAQMPGQSASGSLSGPLPQPSMSPLIARAQATQLPDDSVWEAAQVRLPDVTPRLSSTPRAGDGGRQRMQGLQQPAAYSTPPTAGRSATPRTSRIPSACTPSKLPASPVIASASRQHMQEASLVRQVHRTTPQSARTRQQQASQLAQDAMQSAHHASAAAAAMLAPRPRRADPEEARRQAQLQQVLQGMLRLAASKLQRALEELKINVRAQLTAAAGAVNDLEKHVMALRLRLDQQQRRQELKQLLAIMLPLLRELNCIKAEHGSVVQALCSTLAYDAAHVPLTNGASLGPASVAQLAGLLRQGQQLMQQVAAPLDKMLGPHAQAAAQAADADASAAGDQGLDSEAAAGGNLRDDPSLVTTRVMLGGLVQVVGQNCSTLDECAYQMGQLSDLEVQAASMQALLMQMQQQQLEQEQNLAMMQVA